MNHWRDDEELAAISGDLTRGCFGLISVLCGILLVAILVGVCWLVMVAFADLGEGGSSFLVPGSSFEEEGGA